MTGKWYETYSNFLMDTKKNRQVELEPTKEDSLAYIKKYTDDVLSCGFPQKQGQ